MTAPTLRSPSELLWQPRNWTYWVYLVAVVVALFSVVGDFAGLRLLSLPAATTAVGANIGLGVLIGLIIVWLSVIHRPPTTLVVAAIVWGGVVAVALALYVNDSMLAALPHAIGTGTANDWGAAIAGPTNEEWLKAVGTFAVLALGGRAVSRPIHGLFVGAWCGLGFQIVEDISYAMNGAIDDPTSDAVGLAQILGIRGIIGVLPSHWVFAACSGFGIGYALLRRERPVALRVLFAIAMFAVGWSMHFLWNSPLLVTHLNPLVGLVLKLLIILSGFFVVYRLAMRAEWRWYRRIVHADPTVAAALVTDDEIRSLRTRRRRFRARRRIRKATRRQVRPAVGHRRAKALGKQASRLTRRLQRAQGWVAMTAAYEPDQLPALRARIDGLRSQLSALAAPSSAGTGTEDRRRRHRRADRQRGRRSASTAAGATGSPVDAGTRDAVDAEGSAPPDGAAAAPNRGGLRASDVGRADGTRRGDGVAQPHPEPE